MITPKIKTNNYLKLKLDNPKIRTNNYLKLRLNNPKIRTNKYLKLGTKQISTHVIYQSILLALEKDHAQLTYQIEDCPDHFIKMHRALHCRLSTDVLQLFNFLKSFSTNQN